MRHIEEGSRRTKGHSVAGSYQCPEVEEETLLDLSPSASSLSAQVTASAPAPLYPRSPGLQVPRYQHLPATASFGLRYIRGLGFWRLLLDFSLWFQVEARTVKSDS